MDIGCRLFVSRVLDVSDGLYNQYKWHGCLCLDMRMSLMLCRPCANRLGRVSSIRPLCLHVYRCGIHLLSAVFNPQSEPGAVSLLLHGAMWEKNNTIFVSVNSLIWIFDFVTVSVPASALSVGFSSFRAYRILECAFGCVCVDDLSTTESLTSCRWDFKVKKQTTKVSR